MASFHAHKNCGTYCPEGQSRFRPLKNGVPRQGTSWVGKVTCFKTNPLKCTGARLFGKRLRACLANCYDQRARTSKCLLVWFTYLDRVRLNKRGGWQWQNSKITDPARPERIWLAISVATLWLVSVGGEADANMPASGFDEQQLDSYRPSF